MMPAPAYALPHSALHAPCSKGRHRAAHIHHCPLDEYVKIRLTALYIDLRCGLVHDSLVVLGTQIIHGNQQGDPKLH